MKGTRQAIKYSGNLRLQWNWSVGLAFSLILPVVINFFVDQTAGYVTLIYSALYFSAILLIYFRYRPRILDGLVSFAANFTHEQEQILRQIELPVVIVAADGRVLWVNNRFQTLTDKPENYRKNISTIFPQLVKEVLPTNEWDKDMEISYGERSFRAHMQKISMDKLVDDSELIERNSKNAQNFFYIIYLIDETDLLTLEREKRDSRSIIGLVYIDNYEEAMEAVDEVHSSLMNVLVDREIQRYFGAQGCLAKKLEKDKYLLIGNNKSMEDMVHDHFSVLEDVKTINIGNDTVITISVGLGLDGTGYVQNYEFARSAIEMALARGGDQAVVNRGRQMTFYGGKSQRNEQHTRVKARVKSQALREIMMTKDAVLTMGHRITDMDSLGAAIGVYRAAKTLGKQASIVIGDEAGSVRLWMKALKEDKGYETDLFITHEEAIARCDENTVVIIVDTNRPTMVECPEILSMTNSVVVVDHHRQSIDQIPGAALSYIEPSASSACEMVAEILQYFEENVKLRPLEADCMYAGVLIDTNNFVAKTGARTFEAAAYLRRHGADVTRVRKALRDDMESYKARAEAVRNSEIFMGCYAMSILPSQGLEIPNVIGAQAANELLNIIGVKASFVLTQYEGRVFISARSIDEVNVQIIMERLGGGGHISIAGAQLSGVTPEEAKQRLKETLKQMIENKEI